MGVSVMQQVVDRAKHLQKFRAGFNVRAIEGICNAPEAFQTRSDRHMVVLCDRLQEDIIRQNWVAMMGKAPEQGLVRVIDDLQVNVKPTKQNAKKGRRRRT